VQCAKGTHDGVMMYGNQWPTIILTVPYCIGNVFRLEDQTLLCYKREPSYSLDIQSNVVLTNRWRAEHLLHGCSKNVINGIILIQTVTNLSVGG
jgi:hypothetical protein